MSAVLFSKSRIGFAVTLAVVLFVSVGLAVTAFARPVLQPEVRDYRETGGTFRTADLLVFHQDQAQYVTGGNIGLFQ